MPKQDKRIRSAAAMEAEATIVRKEHAMVVRQHGRWGGMPETHLQWHYDLRRKQNRLHGAMLRWIDTVLERCESVAELTLAELDVRQLPAWINDYITARMTELSSAVRKRRALSAWTR